MRLSTLSLLGAVCMWVPAVAEGQIDPMATVVELRISCDVNGVALENCFETTTDLTDWLWVNAGTPMGRANAPNSFDPVAVRVGPGDFERLHCAGPMNGWTSFQGSGREQTRFVNDDITADPSLGSVCPGGITSDGCTSLNFTDLSAEGRSIGTHWVGNGTSTWDSVDMVADQQGGLGCATSPYAFGWYDVAGNSDGLHYFWDARFIARGARGFAVAYYTHEVESWIYASDLVAEITGPSVIGAAVNSNGGADVRIFGSTVRMIASDTTNLVVYGLLAGGGTIHMHGGIVNVSAQGDATAPAVSLVSIKAGPGDFVHTPDTAFVFNGRANASRTRIIGNNQTVQSPFLWPPSEDPPPIASTDGSDMFVKTNGGASGTESVLYLFDNDCPAPHWRSADDGTCL